MRSVPILFFFTLCVGSAALLNACGPAQQPQQPPLITETEQVNNNANACTIKVGFDAWEPYHYLGQGQQAIGLDIDILQALAAELGCELQLEQNTWTTLLASLQAGEIDLLPGASRNSERETYAWFSEPYRQEQFVLYTRIDAELDFQDLASFVAAGNKVGLVSDYYYGEEIDSLYGSYPQSFVNALIAELNMARLVDEELHAVLEDSFVATAMLRRRGLDRYVGAHNIRLPASDVHFMLSKQSVNEEKLQELNNVIIRLQQQGILNNIMQQYKE